VAPVQDTIVAGKYKLKAGDRLTILIPALHRDPKVWGPDPEAFRPERMAPDLWAKLPPNAWKPFGNGSRYSLLEIL
jgi:cytochrome P450/NADPH-cytochrome P450 reductase